MTDDDGKPELPPLVELPRPSRAMVERFVRSNETHPDEQSIQSRISEVMMADALGRALHLAKITGGPWGGPCVRQIGDQDKNVVELVPYGYEDGNFDCLCEAQAFHLIELMKAQQVVSAVINGN